jgi:Alpha/beta hydrolase domain
VIASACSDDAPPRSSTTTATKTGEASTTLATTTTFTRPAGAVADMSEPLSGGKGVFIGAGTDAALAEADYVEEEFAASGSASSYRVDGDLTGDGDWSFVTDSRADYRTRVLVRRPADPDSFSGTVLVEWLNVSGGVDANPDYASLEEEILRQGHIWIGVSAQRIGVEGGPVLVSAPGTGDLAGKGLKALDAERYGSLAHPGDGFAFDIFTQVARAVRSGAVTDIAPEVVLAVGESQSAIALVTYYNGVQPLTLAFDGFFVHSRGAAGLPLVEPGAYADLAGSIGGEAQRFRSDLAAPILELQAEGDIVGVLNSLGARQDDSDTFRLWEVAGTAHADARLVGAIAQNLDCGVAINDGPLHVVAKAGLRALDLWVRTGTAPTQADRIEIAPGPPPAVQRDELGIALGGIRTPAVDVPIEVLSGEPGPTGGVICILLGSTTPMTDAQIADRYESPAVYEAKYDAALDASIAAGVVLEEDRDAMLAYADPSLVG